MDIRDAFLIIAFLFQKSGWWRFEAKANIPYQAASRKWRYR